MNANEYREILEKADQAKPLAQTDMGDVYTFEDAAAINNLNSIEPKGTGLQTRNKDGSLASTGKRVHAINPNYFFANRIRVKNKKMYVVSGHEPTGFRCIREQEQGKIFIKTIPCYVFNRDKDTNELFIEKVTTISDSEFISEFTDTLSNEAMAEILPMIARHGKERTAVPMPI